MYKEIVTKAIIGKAKKSFNNTYTLLTENNANNVLGCWVINHKFKGSVKNKKVVIDGSYDVNIWYSYDDDKKTAVATKNVEYTEEANINLKNDSDLDGSDIIIRVLKEPNCNNVNIKDDVIEFDIEKELGVEVVNDTKMRIAVDDSEDPWDLLDNDMDTAQESIDKEVKEDFL